MTLVASAVDPDVSAALAIYERLKPLKDALGVGTLTDGELQLFAVVARHTGLDPFSKQIYAIKRAGKVSHQTGIDGYRSIAERTNQYAGSEEATFEDCDCGTDPKAHPKIARVTVRRLFPSGNVIGQVGIARWHDLYPGAGDDGFMWRKAPQRQLAKCAEADGLRKAFPRTFFGVYITDEMTAEPPIEGHSEPVAPTVRERIAAKRQAATTSDTGESPDAAGPVSEQPTAQPSAATCSMESPYGADATCVLEMGHKGNHRSESRESWA